MKDVLVRKFAFGNGREREPNEVLRRFDLILNVDF